MSEAPEKRDREATAATEDLRAKVSIAGFPIRRSLLLLAIFLFALTVRGLYLYQYSSSPHWNLLMLDTHTHDLLARQIMEEGSLGPHPFFRAPFYPYLLGALYSLFGPGLLLPRLINILCGALSCVLIYLLGERLFRPAVGLAASALASLYWVFIYFEGELLLVALYVLLLLLFFHLLLSSEGHRARRLVLAGAALGLATITRPNVLVFYPFVLVWFFLIRRGTGVVRPLLLFFLPALLIPFSVTLRNQFVGGDRVLIAYQAGVNFYIGNNPESNGHMSVPPCDVSAIPESYKARHGNNVWINDDVWYSGYYIAEQERGRRLQPSETQNFWFDRSFAYILEQPGAWLALVFKKVYYFLNAYEIPSNKDLDRFVREEAPLLRLLSPFDFGIIISMGLLGMAVSLCRFRPLFLLYTFVPVYALTNVAFFINTRYRIPTIPFLLLFAVYFLFWIFERFRTGPRRRLIAALLAATALAWFSHTEWFDLKDPRLLSVLQFNQGTAFMKQGDLEAAAACYRETTRIYPEVSKPWERLCRCYNLLGKHHEAMMHAREGLEHFPGSNGLRFQLGTACLRAGKVEEAVAELEEVVADEPDHPAANLNLGLAYFEAGDLGKASSRFNKTLMIRTDDPQIHAVCHLHLGLIAARADRDREALACFQQALKIDPNHLESLLQVAEASLRLKNPAAARDAAQKVLKGDPKNRRARELLDSLNRNP